MSDAAWALQTARQVGPVHPPHAHPHPIHKLHTGPLHSHVAGRTDHLPSNVPNGAYVLPADIVSALGEGNTMAGFRIAKRMFEGAGRHFEGTPYAGDNGPYGQGTGLPYGHAKGGQITIGRNEKQTTVGPGYEEWQTQPSGGVPDPLNGVTGPTLDPGPSFQDQLEDNRNRQDIIDQHVGTPLADGGSAKLADWTPMEQVRSKLKSTEIPSHVREFGSFMDRMATKAATQGISPRDLIKAYIITRGSMRRNERAADQVRAAGLPLPNDAPDKIRPEGAIGQWFHTPMGKIYLDHAEKGLVHEGAIQDATRVMKPFGLSTEASSLPWAARNLPGQEGRVSQMIKAAKEARANPTEWRNWIKGVYGVGPAKAGFMGSMMGIGNQPTLDARQIALHGVPPRDASKPEAVDRLAERQTAMGLQTPPELAPYYQHLAHHTVWDDIGNTQTTHADLMNSMEHAARGGKISHRFRDHVVVHGMIAAGLPHLREGRESGGSLYDGQDGIPVAVAGGEHVLAPHEVMFAGMGDLDAGHRALDEFVIRQRAKTVKTLKGLPGPKRD